LDILVCPENARSELGRELEFLYSNKQLFSSVTRWRNLGLLSTYWKKSLWSLTSWFFPSKAELMMELKNAFQISPNHRQ